MLETITELMNVQVADKVMSKLDGNKNWIIHTEIKDGKIVIRFAGKKGQGEFYQNCFLSEIVKYHYRWFYFTYKKDYKEALEMLLANGAELQLPLW